MKNKIFTAIYLLATTVSLTAVGFGLYAYQSTVDELDSVTVNVDSLTRELASMEPEVFNAIQEDEIYSASDIGDTIANHQTTLSGLDNDFDVTVAINNAIIDFDKLIKDNKGDASIWLPVKLPNDTAVWSFNTIYSSANSTFPVIWTCYASSDSSKTKLLAYATATYYSEDQIVSKPVVKTTKYYDELTNDVVTEGGMTGEEVENE